MARIGRFVSFEEDSNPMGSDVKAVVAVAVMAAVGVVGTAATVAATGLPVLPRPAVQEPAPPLPDPPAFADARVVDLPASKAVWAIVNVPDVPVSGLSETAPGIRLGGAVDAGTGWTCGASLPVAPVVSADRSWSGAVPWKDGGLRESSGVVVSAGAYSAGQGGSAFALLRERVAGCRDRDANMSVSDRSGLGVEAMRVTRSGNGPKIVTDVWRRGDVILYVQASGASADPAGVSTFVDTHAAGVLEPVCVNQDAGVQDAARSPWAGLDTFTGLTVDKEVQWQPVPVETPAPAAGAQRVSVPQEPLELPGEPGRPNPPLSRPEGMPRSLPEKVSPPSPPQAPVEAETTATVGLRQEDTTGPGCGWAFTGMSAPPFDDVTAQRELEERESAAQDAMTKEQQRYANDVSAYWTAWAKYVSDAGDYRDYVTRMGSVTKQWDAVRALDEKYASELAAYNKAVQDRDKFLADQKKAQDAFDAAAKVCSTPPPVRTTVTTTTEVVTITITEQPSPTSGSPAPPKVTTTTTTTTSPVTVTLPPPERDCPPERPAILDQDPPEVPDKPTPPPGHPDR